MKNVHFPLPSLLNSTLVVSIFAFATSCGTDSPKETRNEGVKVTVATSEGNSAGKESSQSYSDMALGLELGLAAEAEATNPTDVAECEKYLGSKAVVSSIRGNQPVEKVVVRDFGFLEIAANQPVIDVTLEADGEFAAVKGLCIVVRANQPLVRMALKGVTIEKFHYVVHANQPRLDAVADATSSFKDLSVKVRANQSHVTFGGAGKVACDSLKKDEQGNQNVFECKSGK